MIHIRRSAIVHYTPMQMFDLVNDVEMYPQRFAWCAGARVVTESADYRIARLDVRFAGFKHSFTTRNHLLRPELIDLQLVEGPFKNLTGQWRFLTLGEKGCQVQFALDFAYTSHLVGAALRLGFHGLANHMVDDFCREAERLYGNC